MLRASGIDWSFDDAGARRHVLRGLSAEFAEGGAYALTGPSGCGKTTLLSIFSLHARPQSGELAFAGDDLCALGERDAQRFRRDRVGLIFQTFRLLDTLTVAEQVVFTSHARNKPEAARAGHALVERFGLTHVRNHLPASLSGGEKQRVALALALMGKPPLVLADEPTAALDGENAALAMRALRDYAREHAAVVLIASHDRELVARCDGELQLGAPDVFARTHRFSPRKPEAA